MAKKRLIPKLQMRASIKNPSRMVLVTTVGFQDSIEVGDPVSQAKIYQSQAADELLFLDLDASDQNRAPRIEIIERAAEEIFMPFTVGGGVRSVEDFRRLLRHGADKVSVNSHAFRNPTLISEAANAFGSQCVVLSIDYRYDADGEARVHIHNGRTATQKSVAAWAQEAEALGCGELLITSIDRDGGREGLDCDLARKISELVSIPVIISGGAGKTQDFIAAFQKTNVSAVSAGTYFCFKDENPMQTRSQIKNHGINIRIVT